MQIELAPIRVPDVSINNQDGSVPNGPRSLAPRGGRKSCVGMSSWEGRALIRSGIPDAGKVSVVCTRHSIRNHDFRTPLPLAKGLCALGGIESEGGVEIKSPFVCLMNCPLAVPSFCLFVSDSPASPPSINANPQ